MLSADDLGLYGFQVLGFKPGFSRVCFLTSDIPVLYVDLFTGVRPGAKNNLYLQVMIGLVAIIGGTWIAVGGFQDRDIQVILSGVLFLGMVYGSDKLSDGQIFQAPGSWPAMSFSLTVPLTIVDVILRPVLGIKKNTAVFGTVDWFASILKGMPLSGQYQYNGVMVPIYETTLVVSITLVSYKAVRRLFIFLGLSPYTAGILAASSVFS